eukprot:1664009-Rhodomonas_salina.3
MRGTALVYGAPECVVLSSSERAVLTWGKVLQNAWYSMVLSSYMMLLCAWYGMPGTDFGYGATTECVVLSSYIMLLGAKTARRVPTSYLAPPTVLFPLVASYARAMALNSTEVPT